MTPSCQLFIAKYLSFIHDFCYDIVTWNMEPIIFNTQLSASLIGFRKKIPCKSTFHRLKLKTEQRKFILCLSNHDNNLIDNLTDQLFLHFLKPYFVFGSKSTNALTM